MLHYTVNIPVSFTIFSDRCFKGTNYYDYCQEPEANTVHITSVLDLSKREIPWNVIKDQPPAI